MNKLTRKQIYEFWERFGWHKEIATYVKDFEYDVLLAPDEELVEGFEGFIPDHTPPINLKTLFELAVPRAIDRIIAEKMCRSDVAYAILFKKWLQKLELDTSNYAGTLFSTIWEVMQTKEVK